MAVSLITIEKRYGTTTMAIFSVSLPGKRAVFMRVATTPYGDEHRGVVIVDARKFLKLWRADPYQHHQEIAEGNPATWRRDYKFKYAVDGFSYGFKNPVPLPEIGYAEEDIRSVTYKFLRFGRKEHIRRARFVSFLDGITRTIWLLSHGCKAFPVECSDSRRRRMLLKINDLPHMTFVNIKSIESTTYVFYAASNETSF